jgi:c-di-GMP-binding flagellar brake protein YcgR
MQERRNSIRRKDDHALLAQLREAQNASPGETSATKELVRARRRAIRHNCKVGINMLIKHRQGMSDTWSTDTFAVEGRILDLSIEGASLYTKKQLDTHQELRLVIQLEDKTSIQSEAIVRWVKAASQKGGYTSGVAFTKVSGKDQKKIQKFLKVLDETFGL